MSTLREVFQFCDGQSFSVIAQVIDWSPSGVSSLHQAAVALGPESVILGDAALEILPNQIILKGGYGTKEAY